LCKTLKKEVKMAKINGDDPAFPFWGPGGGYGDAVVLENQDGHRQIIDFKPGLTKREYFAAQVAIGILSSNRCPAFFGDVASDIISMTDRLIEELNK
jgi:hypothetical protein